MDNNVPHNGIITSPRHVTNHHSSSTNTNHSCERCARYEQTLLTLKHKIINTGSLLKMYRKCQDELNNKFESEKQLQSELSHAEAVISVHKQQTVRYRDIERDNTMLHKQLKQALIAQRSKNEQVKQLKALTEQRVSHEQYDELHKEVLKLRVRVDKHYVRAQQRKEKLQFTTLSANLRKDRDKLKEQNVQLHNTNVSLLEELQEMKKKEVSIRMSAPASVPDKQKQQKESTTTVSSKALNTQQQQQQRKIKAAITLAARSLNEMKKRNDALQRKMDVMGKQNEQLTAELLAKERHFNAHIKERTKQHKFERKKQQQQWQKQQKQQQHRSTNTQTVSMTYAHTNTDTDTNTHTHTATQLRNRKRKRAHNEENLMSLPFPVLVPMSSLAILRTGSI